MPTDRRKAHGYRTWWTRERVLAGLCRLYAETGQAPLGGPQYRALTEGSDYGLKGARRRYPTPETVMRYWPSYARAWLEAGVECSGKLLWKIPGGVEGLPWVRLREEGERYGRLVVVAFAGYRQHKHARLALWRCRCDCGQECIVRSGRFKNKRECRRCARARSIARRRAEAEAARRAAAQVQPSVVQPSTREQV